MKPMERILRGGLYRSRDNMILGVCKGIADYFQFSVFWTRTIALIVLFLSGFWAMIGLYFLAALLMKPEPVLPINTDDEQTFYDSYVHSRKSAAHQLKIKHESLEQRLRWLEHIVTRPEFDWNRKMNH